MRLAGQDYRPSSAINAYVIGRWTTVRRPSEIVTHARQPESLRDRGQDGCEHERLIPFLTLRVKGTPHPPHCTTFTIHATS